MGRVKRAYFFTDASYHASAPSTSAWAVVHLQEDDRGIAYYQHTYSNHALSVSKDMADSITSSTSTELGAIPWAVIASIL
eukprot:8570265-Pyramimonas_sp.AAC.1